MTMRGRRGDADHDDGIEREGQHALAEQHFVVVLDDLRPIEVQRWRHLRQDLDPLLGGQHREIEEGRGAHDAERDQEQVGDDPARADLHRDAPGRICTYFSITVVPTARISSIM